VVKLKFNLKKLEEDKKLNFEERLRFIDLYVEWLKKTPNKVWSNHQKDIVNRRSGRKN